MKTPASRYAISLLLCLVIAAASCAKVDNRLIGKWEAEFKTIAGIKGNMMIEFTRKGKLGIRLGKGGPVFRFDYSIKDNAIVFSERGIQQEIPYSFKGETLVLSYPNLGELTFTRAK